MTDWRSKAVCQGASGFDERESTRGPVPAEKFSVAYTYCLNCPVRRECRDFADRTQSVGTFGGQYRELLTGSQYRVYDAPRQYRVEKYTSGLRIAGDEKVTAERVVSSDLVSMHDALSILGINDRRTLTKFLTRRCIRPVIYGSGPRPSYYDPEDIERARRHIEDFRSIPEGSCSRSEAMEALGYADKKSFMARMRRENIKPIVPGIGPRQSRYSITDIEKVKGA